MKFYNLADTLVVIKHLATIYIRLCAQRFTRYFHEAVQLESISWATSFKTNSIYLMLRIAAVVAMIVVLSNVFCNILLENVVMRKCYMKTVETNLAYVHKLSMCW